MNYVPLPTIVLLCTPRSFSSVTNAMLGCHPGLAALPEQNLFLADTLGGLLKHERTFGSKRGYLAGTKRAVAALEFGAQHEAALQEAERWIRCRWFWKTHRMFNWFRRKVAPCALVYKSPRTAMSQAAMHRMLTANPEARFLYLTREPGAAIADWAASFGQQGLSANRFFAEVWLQSNRRILDILQGIAADRVLSIKGENVVNHPTQSMSTIMQWLGMNEGQDAITGMLHPERWQFVGSLPSLSALDNDAGFLEAPHLRPTSEPRLSVEALELPPELTKQVNHVGKALGYCL